MRPVGDDAAVSVVVYRLPGPATPDPEARRLVSRQGVVRGGPVAWMVLDESEFDFLREELESGNCLGMAFDILRTEGLEVAFLAGRSRDLIYGWTSHRDSRGERALMLQVIPQPHIRRRAEAGRN